MPTYKIETLEKWLMSIGYTVEAENKDEAMKLIRHGQAGSEWYEPVGDDDTDKIVKVLICEKIEENPKRTFKR